MATLACPNSISEGFLQHYICIHHSEGTATQLGCGLFSGSIHEAELGIHGELRSTEASVATLT